MGLATFSFDVAPGAPGRAAIAAAVEQQLASVTSWQLLSDLWMLELPGIADFETFGAALEGLYAQHRGDFDYFALHFDPAGGPVLIAPNPAVRQPQPVPRRRGVATRALEAGPRATIEVVDPRPVLTQLEDLHATFERDRRRRPRVARDRKVEKDGRESGPRGGRARGRGPRTGGRHTGRRAPSRRRAGKRRR